MNRFPINLVQFDGALLPSAPISIVSADRYGEWFGRTQVGFGTHIEMQTIQVSSFSSLGIVIPDSNPVIRIYAGSAPIRNYRMPIDVTAPAAKGVFHGKFTPSSLDSACHAFSLISYLVKGSPKAMYATFEILVGGHKSGPIQSIFGVSLPAGATAIAHQESGVVSFGKRAYLDTGSSE